MSKYSYDVLDTWGQVTALRRHWHALSSSSGVKHPFTGFDWFRCWYHSYCRPEDLRVIVVKSGQLIKAIFPGMLIRQVIAGIQFRIFSYAANGHSPRCAILARAEDIEATKAAITAPFRQFAEEIDLISFPSIEASSCTDLAMNTLDMPSLFLHTEHTFLSPAFDISKGWNPYFHSRSKNFRHRIRQGINRASRFGKLDFQFALPGDDLTQATLSVESVDRKTWQHQDGTGLFSTLENRKFYTSLIQEKMSDMPPVLGFLKLGGQIAAFELGVCSNSIVFLLKYGFDPAFAQCRPGTLVQKYLCEYLSGLAVKEIDLVGETTDEKASWATHFRKHNNYWLINKSSPRGRFLSLAIPVFREAKRRGFVSRFPNVLKLLI